MRLAVIADIHGSLPSLEAVLREIHARSVDGLLVASDMTCGPNFSEELEFAFHKAAQAGFPDCEYVPENIWDAAAQSFDWERYVL